MRPRSTTGAAPASSRRFVASQPPPPYALTLGAVGAWRVKSPNPAGAQRVASISPALPPPSPVTSQQQ